MKTYLTPTNWSSFLNCITPPHVSLNYWDVCVRAYVCPVLLRYSTPFSYSLSWISHECHELLQRLLCSLISLAPLPLRVKLDSLEHAARKASIRECFYSNRLPGSVWGNTTFRNHQGNKPLRIPPWPPYSLSNIPKVVGCIISLKIPQQESPCWS